LPLLAKIDDICGEEKISSFLKKHDIPVFFKDAAYHAAAEYDLPVPGSTELLPETVRLGVNPRYRGKHLSGLLRHEFCHIQQSFARLGLPPHPVSPLDMLWFLRVIEADAESYNALCLFKLKLSGDGELFDYRCWCGGYSRIYRAIKKQYKKDPSSLNDGRLRRTAFDAWFPHGWFSRDSIQVQYEMHALAIHSTLKDMWGQKWIETPPDRCGYNRHRRLGW